MKLEKDDGEFERLLALAVVSNFGHGFGAINYVFDLSRGKRRLAPLPSDLQTKITQPRMIIRAPAKRPMKLAI